MQQDYLDNLSGTSTEVKPTTVAKGTRFYETDTGAEYVFQNNKWQPAPSFIRVDSNGKLGIFNAANVEVAYFDSGGGLVFLGSALSTLYPNISFDAPQNMYLRLGTGKAIEIDFGGASSLDYGPNGIYRLAGIPAVNLGVTLTVADSTWLTGNTALISSLATWTVGAVDQDFEATFFLVIVAFTSGSVSCTVNYTDPTNTIRNAIVSLTNNVTGVPTPVIQGGGDMSGSAPFRAKAGTTITLKTTGTPTSLTYDIIAKIKEVS